MKKKKLLALMVFVIIATGIPVFSVSAMEGKDDNVQKISVNKAGNQERKIVADGFCGDSVTYSLSEDGVLTISGSGRMADYEWGDSPLYEYQNEINTIVIEEGVTYIGKNAFCESSMLKEVTFSTSVMEIGESAFVDCYGLNKVNFCEGLTSIGVAAFSGCKNLTSVQLPVSLKNIGDSAFIYSGLTSIFIPRNVEYIGASAFDNQTMEHMEIDSNNQGYIYEGHFLYNKDKTQIVGVLGNIGEEVTIADTVTSIGKSAFSGCSTLKKITIPDTVVSIGASAFASTGLTSITLPGGLTRLEEYTFAGCNVLKEVVFSKSIKEIGARAFYYCEGLEYIELSESVEKIETAAFYNCSNLVTIKLPSSMKSIGEQAFLSCKGLETITIPNGIKSLEYQIFGGCSKLQKVVLPNTLTSIEKEAFTQCNTLLEIEIPGSVTNIGNGAFAYCRSLKEVTIPDGVESLGETVFRQCDALVKVIIPKSVTSIDKTLFYLTNHEITIVGEAGSYAQTFAKEIGMPFQLLDGTIIQPTCTITYDPNGGLMIGETSKTVIKKTSVSNHPIATREGYQFKGWYLYRTGGTKIPDNMIINSDLTVYAVWEKVASDTENGGNKDENQVNNNSGNNESTNNDKNNSNQKPSDNKENAEQKDSNSNKDISNEADAPVQVNKVYTVGGYKYKALNKSEVAFAGLKSNKTKKVVINKTVKINGKNFKVTTIAAKALRGKTITSLVIGANIKKIESKALENCKKLKKITIKSSQINKMGKNAFKGIPKTTKVKVPKKKRTSYKKQLKKAGLNSKVKVSS